MTEFPLFARAQRAGVFDGESAVIVAPTATGKSHIGREAIARALSRGQPGPHAYLVPFRSLASEVGEMLQETLGPSGTTVRLATGDHRDPLQPERCEVIVATYESFAGLMRGGSFKPGVVVADEVHLLADQTRGATVEGLLARLTGGRCGSLLALSAVVDNDSELADWLGVQAILGDRGDRPVELALALELADELDSAVEEHLECCRDGEQALVFCASRAGAERAARLLSERLAGCLPADVQAQLQRLSDELHADDPDLDERALKLFPTGVIYHHAGLAKPLRRQIEHAYRERWLRAIACTPTLAAGVNLPAGVVVVRDISRSQTVRGRRHQRPLPSGEVLNMLGRAARPHLVSSGRGVALAKQEVAEMPEIAELQEAIAAGRGGEVRSRLPDSFEAIMRFALSVIAERGAETSAEHVASVYRRTLAFCQAPEDISFDRAFEEDMMEDLPQYAKVIDQREREGKQIYIADHRLSPEGVHARVHSSTHVYEVTLGVTEIACTCPAASKWQKGKICRHEALVIHDLLFDPSVDRETRNRAIYNCAHLFGSTLDTGTKLAQALRILSDWRLIEPAPGAWRATELGFVAAGSWFDLLLVHQVIERIAALGGRPADHGEIARLAVEDYFGESEQERWQQATEQWLVEVAIGDIKLPAKKRRADFEREMQDSLAQVCMLYEGAAKALSRPEVAQAARRAAGALRYGVAPELVPLMALGLPQLRRARCRYLYERGIRDVSDLAGADPGELGDPRRAPEAYVSDWVRRAREIEQARGATMEEHDALLDELIARFQIDPAALGDAEEDSEPDGDDEDWGVAEDA